MTLITRQSCSGLMLSAVLGWAGLAHADAVTEWNAIALQTIASAAAPHVGPPTIIDLANVHAAVHDAVQAIEGRYEPYHSHIQGATGSPSAAVAKAAHDVLVAIFPAQQTSLDTTYDAYLATNGLATNDPGVAVGAQAAAALLALRANDGAFPNPPPPPFVGGTGIGDWRPTPSFLPGAPPGFSPMAAPWLPSVTPFTLENTSQFRAKTRPRKSSMPGCCSAFTSASPTPLPGGRVVVSRTGRSRATCGPSKATKRGSSRLRRRGRSRRRRSRRHRSSRALP